MYGSRPSVCDKGGVQDPSLVVERCKSKKASKTADA